MTTPVQDLFLYGAYQLLRKSASHKLCAEQVFSAGLAWTPADVSLKAPIPARSQGMTCRLLQKEVTSQAI